MVFDIGDLHVKGREWKVGKWRSRGLLLKEGIGRGGKGEGRGREEREGSSLPYNNKNRSRAPGQQVSTWPPVKMLQTSWPLMGSP